MRFLLLAVLASPAFPCSEYPCTDCVSCSDDGNSWMENNNKRCREWANEDRCRQDNWINNNICMESCHDKGHGYVTCCPGEDCSYEYSYDCALSRTCPQSHAPSSCAHGVAQTGGG